MKAALIVIHFAVDVVILQKPAVCSWVFKINKLIFIKAFCSVNLRINYTGSGLGCVCVFNKSWQRRDEENE